MGCGDAGSLRAVETTVTIGLLGCGNVGAALVALVAGRSDEVVARTGIRLRIGRIAVRSLDRRRPDHIDAGKLTTDAQGLVNDPEIDLVVEVMGGVDPAHGLISTALRAGKPVVTANKELIAAVGGELFGEADAAGVDLLFEAAVAGGIPIVRVLRESLAAEDVRRVLGIVNGTTNYVLTKMAEEGWSYSDALAEAQRLGYAEPDPTADVEGLDAAAKAAIIATIVFGSTVVASDVRAEGITGVTPTDIDFAARLGYVVKLLAFAEQFDDGTVGVRVHPAMLPAEHPLASVRDSFNAVYVEGASVGELMFYGRGAGGAPTASALLGDVLDAAANLSKGAHASLGSFRPASLRPADELRCEFYVKLAVADRPGVLAAVAGVFGDHGVSIRATEQEAFDLGAETPDGTARLVFITHTAREADVVSTLDALASMAEVSSVDSVLRVLAGS